MHQNNTFEGMALHVYMHVLFLIAFGGFIHFGNSGDIHDETRLNYSLFPSCFSSTQQNGATDLF